VRGDAGRTREIGKLLLALFADAKATKDYAEQLFGIGVPDDVADRVHGSTEFLGDELWRQRIFERLERSAKIRGRALQASLRVGR
jgi:hypothetical protein